MRFKNRAACTVKTNLPGTDWSYHMCILCPCHDVQLLDGLIWHFREKIVFGDFLGAAQS